MDSQLNSEVVTINQNYRDQQYINVNKAQLSVTNARSVYFLD
jgi:hypothetical protein